MFTDNTNIINSKKTIYYELNEYNFYYNVAFLITHNIINTNKACKLVEQLKKRGKNGTIIYIKKEDDSFVVKRTAFDARLFGTTLYIHFWSMKNDPTFDPGFNTTIKTNKIKEWKVEFLDNITYNSEEL